jgi:anti-sigma regulatory factor (Ser/Thr protein kinase)
MRRWLTGIRADRDASADLLAAVGEACANAIEHAYGAAGGMVSVHLEHHPPDVVAVIEDTGRWRAPRNGFRGRGITLMYALSDEVSIDPADAGTRVRIRRAIAGGGGGNRSGPLPSDQMHARRLPEAQQDNRKPSPDPLS